LLLKEAEAAEAIRLRSQASALKVGEKSLREEMDVLKERNSALEKERDSLDSALKVAEKSLREEMDVLKEHNSALEKERDSLDAKVTESQAVTANKERKVADLNSIITFIKSHNDELVDQVCACAGDFLFRLREQVAGYEHLQEAIEAFQDAQIKIMEDKLAKLETKVVEVVLHLEETFCPRLLTTIAGQRWLLTHGMKLIVVKCLNSPEYLSALGAFIGHAIEKGMQARLAAGINHDVDQLMVPIHCFEDQVLNGLLLVSLCPNGTFICCVTELVKKLFRKLVLLSTTALSTTFATTSSIIPISTDDYEVVDAENVQRNDTSFLNFEEETLNATL
ncbi:hypothetical protein Tco_1266541, partial [Tanacetum coccineum]